MEQIVNGLESHFMTAVLVSGALGLLIVAAVGYVWWRGRHWVDRGRTSLAIGRQTMLLTQADDPRPTRPTAGASGSSGGSAGPREEPAAGGAEQFGSRLVREAAARAAALRDAWDRSYREARGSRAPSEKSATVSDAPTVLDDLLHEQRETNALLRQLLDRLGPPQT